MEEHTSTNQQAASLHEGATPAADRWLLRVRGIVLTTIVDAKGRRIGPLTIDDLQDRSTGKHHVDKNKEDDEDEENRSVGQMKAFPSLFEVSIPGASYNPGRSFTSVFLNKVDTYTFALQGQSPSAVDVYLTAFNARAKLDTVFFQGIPMTDVSSASFVYNTVDPLESIVISLRATPGGNVQQIPPTAILGPEASADYIAPTTTLGINSDNVATVSATDNPGGSGVLRTYYTTDLRTYTVYTKPFLIPPDAQIVRAFSIDRNGNQEYPGALRPVLGVNPTRVVFKATVGETQIPAQRVHVLNLDPAPLTGPLEWLIARGKDAPWLVVQPEGGRTPGLITLSVDIIGLQPGIYRGNVVVRSLTPGTVFAVREVVVELEVRDGGPPIQ